MELNNSILHYAIMKNIVKLGYAPKIDDIAKHFDTSKLEVVEALHITVDLRKFQEWVIRIDKPYRQASEVIYCFSCQTSSEN